MKYDNIMQDWTTLKTSSASTLVQSEPYWLDSKETSSLALFVTIKAISNADLKLQTATNITGPWTDVAAIPSLDPLGEYFFEAKDGASWSLERYIRWSVVFSGSGEICFWIGANIK